MHPRFNVLMGLILIGSLLVFAAELIIPLQVIAINGALDKYGCHRDNKGKYHCHKGPCATRTFDSQNAMLEAGCKNR